MVMTFVCSFAIPLHACLIIVSHYVVFLTEYIPSTKIATGALPRERDRAGNAVLQPGTGSVHLLPVRGARP